jgi:hypothetical protein
VDFATTLHHRTLPELLIVNLCSNVSLFSKLKIFPVFLGLSQFFSAASVKKNPTLKIISQGNSVWRKLVFQKVLSLKIWYSMGKFYHRGTVFNLEKVSSEYCQIGIS